MKMVKFSRHAKTMQDLEHRSTTGWLVQHREWELHYKKIVTLAVLVHVKKNLVKMEQLK